MAIISSKWTADVAEDALAAAISTASGDTPTRCCWMRTASAGEFREVVGDQGPHTLRRLALGVVGGFAETPGAFDSAYRAAAKPNFRTFLENVICINALAVAPTFRHHSSTGLG